MPEIKIPAGNESISITVNEGKELADLVSKHKFSQCLEIGLAYGRSSCYLLSSSEQVHLTSIDPFQATDYKNFGLQNIKDNNLSDRHQHISLLSEVALPKLMEEKKSFDFILIDGDHKFDGAFVDFFYCAKLLNKGGIIAIDDYWMRSLILLKQFIKKNRSDFKEVKLQSTNLFAFQKIGDDPRDGMHFAEFITFKGMIKYHLNRLAWENKTLLGKLILKLKKLRK